MNHSWAPALDGYAGIEASPDSIRARNLRARNSRAARPCFRSGLPPTSTATLSATGPWMTLRSVNNPAAGVAQRTRTGRHFSGMTRRDLAFVHLHRSIKAAYLACRLLDLRNGFASDIGHNQHSHSVHMFR